MSDDNLNLKTETEGEEGSETAEDEAASSGSEYDSSFATASADEEPLDDGHLTVDDLPSDGQAREPSEKSSRSSRSENSVRLKKVFVRPKNQEPKHPIFSSPYARRIARRAFGPKKPKWYTPLTSTQLYLFKDIMNYVELGRQTLFRFDDFMEALQDFEPSIRTDEVLDVLDGMEKNEFEELDFAKFLFLLAYKDHPLEKDESGDIDKKMSSPVVTPRQCLILSAISYYVLITSPEDIERYYIANTRRKATVLHYHMEAARLSNLSERQMEIKQKKAMRHLGPLFAITGSPYAQPVPFVRRRKTPKKSSMRKPSNSEKEKDMPDSLEVPDTKGRTHRLSKEEEDKIVYNMNYGRIPLPRMNIPEGKRAQMRKKCTVEMRDYIIKKTNEAMEDYRDRLKKASVVYNRASYKSILKKGFPSASDKRTFTETFQRYLPLRESDIQNYSLWVRPLGYLVKHNGKSLDVDKYAFGSKIE